MNKHIIQLLDSNNRVIIPDFGAFIIKQKNPKVVVFNEFLRYNDGLLIDFVAKEENTDRETAKKRITDFVARINASFDKKEPFSLDELGMLEKEASGKITLLEKGEVTAKEKPAKAESNKKPEKPKTEPEKKEVAKEIKPAEKKETTAPKESVKKDTSAAKEVPLEIDKKPVKEEPAEKIKTVTSEKATTVPIPDKEPEKAAKAASPEKPAETPKVTAEPDKKPVQAPPLRREPVSRSPLTTKKPAGKRNVVQITIWIVLILIVNGIILSWFFFNEEVTGLFSGNKKEVPLEDLVDEEEPATAVPAEEDFSPTSDETIIQEPQQQAPAKTQAQPVKTSPQPAISGKRYYIVAGCFSDENNADNLVQTLLEQGYPAQKFGIISNLSCVSYSSFADKAEAGRELNKIRSEVQSDAWLKYY